MKRRHVVVATTAAVAGFLSGVAIGQVNVSMWASCDNEFNIYTGTPAGTLAYVGGETNWPVATLFSFQMNAGYIYVAARDYGGVYGLGGYLSLDGSPYSAILPGAGWESFLTSAMPQLPDQATVDALISTANAGNLWVPSTAGTASIGSGLPAQYGSLPTQGCIWDPRAGTFNVIVFRKEVVPSPSTLVPMALGLLALRRRRSA